jgi:hypothetical protein
MQAGRFPERANARGTHLSTRSGVLLNTVSYKVRVIL